MRMRRPEQFSDSKEEESPVLDRSLFEYHLDTVTSRSDEKAFEHFCRKLAQKELCPNLLPQTGPTGGGDSKVDTETYPVAPEIADRWYQGDVNAGSERWAFAISAKKDWKPKVRSDVKKIIETNRSYSRIYFMSNQYIRDKDRADIEDELSKAYGVPVRILDRTWIIEKVFERGHWALAIEALNISVSTSQKRVHSGPLDTERQAHLDELEAQIADTSRYAGVEYQLAEDCLDAAVLARELELGRVEVDGRFDRAERIAKRVNYRPQKLRVKYQRAWTACYWFDDLETTDDLYDDIEALALPSDQTDDLELLHNIWTILASGVKTGRLSDPEGKLLQRTERLKARLQSLAEQVERPNNAANAESMLCTLQIIESPHDKEVINSSIRRLAAVFSKSERLGGYQFDRFAKIFEELGNLTGGEPAYDEAFEIILPILERRRSEGAAGFALLRRGFQKIDEGKNIEAIRLLGRAQQKLIKHEYRDKLVLSLVACAQAYEQVGLLWAAHSNLLAAASVAFADFDRGGQISNVALRSIQRLVWIEIQLGRVPQALEYLSFQQILVSHLQMEDENKERSDQQFQHQDAVLAMLLLRSSLKQLAAMESLPKTLERHGLFVSAMTLLFSLGHEEALSAEGYIPSGMSREELYETFKRLSEQPAKESLPAQPEVFDEPFVTFRSSVLGCEWAVSVELDETAIRIAEAFLGFVEAFFATSLDRDAIPHRQHINIVVCKHKSDESSNDDPALQIVLDDPDALARIEYSRAYDPDKDLAEGKLLEFLRDSLAVIIPRVLYVPDFTKYFSRIADVEEGFGRSLSFSNVFASASNVVGSNTGYRLSEWLDEESRYPLKRDQVVSFETVAEQREPKKYGVGEPPDELMQTEGLRHDQRRVLSIIDIEAWDQAKWRGVGIIIPPYRPPLMALLFENEHAARKIFSGWLKRFGEEDKEEKIRVSILTGVNRQHPSSYKVVIGANIDKELENASPANQFVILSRIQEMHNPNPANLESMLSAYKEYGCFLLAPAIISPARQQPDLLLDMAILKRELLVRPAWEIGDNDPDSIAISPSDDPIIPDGVIDPPVAGTLLRRKKMRE